METLAVGCGAGFSGDRLDGAPPVVRTLIARGGPAALIFENLAERTLAFQALTRRRDPSLGYEPLLTQELRPVLADCLRHGITIVGNFGAANPQGAAETILSANILGGMCARVCPTEVLCEQACVRNTNEDKPVEIALLQRFATDQYFAKPGAPMFTRAAASGKRVAAVGAGPAGLAFAHRAAMLGHAVVLFDANPKPGGLNEYGLATYKTVDDFAQKEIDWLLSIGGIEVRCDQALGRERLLGEWIARPDHVRPQPAGPGVGGYARRKLTGRRAEEGDLRPVVGLPERRDHRLDRLVVDAGVEGDRLRRRGCRRARAAPRAGGQGEGQREEGPRDRASIMELAATLVRDSAAATLFTEHDVDVVFRFAARVIVLDRGRIIADGSPAAVRADRRVQAVYLGTEA